MFVSFSKGSIFMKLYEKFVFPYATYSETRINMFKFRKGRKKKTSLLLFQYAYNAIPTINMAGIHEKYEN